jgi:hypothetical protein
MEISQAVKDKIAEAIELWAEETLEGKPAILANATFFSMVKALQDKTDEINTKFASV